MPRSKHAFTDGSAFSKGIRGQLGGRSAPTVINRAYSLEQFWDGRAKTLEEQAKGPIANPIEMGHAHDLCEKCVGAIAGYRARFKDAFGDEKVTIDRIAQAVATFERMVLSGNSPYDQFKAGEKTALSESQQRGMDIFFSNNARCDSCHEGINFTNGKYANVGIGADKPEPDLGRYAISKQEEDRGALKPADPRNTGPTRQQSEDSGGGRRPLQQRRRQRQQKPAGLHQDVRPQPQGPGRRTRRVLTQRRGWQHIKPPGFHRVCGRKGEW